MKKRNYILGLDGLRALAILGVVFYHLTPFVVSGGFLGVNVFFIISGYLLTQKMSDLMDSGVSLSYFVKQTIMKRLRSQFKPLIYTMAITVGLVFFIQPKLLQNIAVMFGASATFINNLVQIGLGLSYFERHFGQSVFTHFWYLSALMQMIIVWALSYYILRKLSRGNGMPLIGLTVGIAVSFALMILLFNVDQLTRVYYGTDTRFFDFLIGAWVALLQDDLRRMIYRSKYAQLQVTFGGLIALIALLILVFIAKDDMSITYFVFFLLFDIVSAYLIVTGLNEQSFILPVLDNSFMRYIGKRSFEWYLWYFPVLILGQTFLELSNGLNIAILLLILVVVSELFYQLLQRKDVYQPKKILFFFARLVTSIRQKRMQFTVVELLKYGVLPLFIVIVLLTAPIGQNAVVAQLQEQLQANEKLQAQQAEQTGTLQASQPSSSANTNGNQTTTPSQLTSQQVVTRQITFIGDSVTLSIFPTLKTHFPNSQIDGKVSRQFYHGRDVADALAAQNVLHKEVVVFLGANSPFTKANATELLDYLGSDRTIYFVTIRGNKSWQNDMNKMMQDLTKTYRNLKIIDWASHSNSHAEWFLEDAVHPNTEGIDRLVAFFYEQLK